MATAVAPNRVLTTPRDAESAESVLAALRGAEGFLSVGRGTEPPASLPREVGVLLQQVLEAVAAGREISISTVPVELTTSTAADLIGVSRPTLMKMVARGELSAHKVGSHTRLTSRDVFEFIRARQDRRRTAFDQLRDLLDG